MSESLIKQIAQISLIAENEIEEEICGILKSV